MAEDYTVEDYRAAARRAMEAGNMAAAEELAQAGIALQRRQAEGPTLQRDADGSPVILTPPRADAPEAPAAEPRTGAERVAGDVARFAGQYGPVAEDVARSAGSGVVRGAVALADLPGALPRALDRGLAAGARFFMGENAPEWTQRPAQYYQDNPTPARALATADEAGPVARAMEYDPQTTAGEYAQTAGEFLPGALLGPGPAAGNAVRYGLIPAAASETAGQLTEGTAAEPWARAGAGIAAGVLAARPTQTARPAIPRADPEDARFAEILMRHGVRPTVGQTTGSGTLRRLEGTAGMDEGQLADFTRAVMRTAGSRAPRATEGAMEAASAAIVREMDDAVAGITFTPSTAMAQQADDVVQDYLRATAQGSVVPDVRNIADEIIDAATSGGTRQISLSTLRDWRSRLGRLMRSPDAQTREAAYGLRAMIDDATEAQLVAAGRTADVERLATARVQYRNWLAIADAATRAGAENGILSPTVLMGAITRTQGRRAVAVGDTTDLGQLARAGAALFRPMPTVEPGAVRHFSPLLTGAGVGGLAAQQTGQNPVMGAALGALVPAVSERIIRSNALQGFLMDPGGAAVNALRTLPGTSQQF